MLESLLIGGGFAVFAGLQPGPFQAFLLSRVATDGWKRTLPAVFAPLLSDGPIALLAITVLAQLPDTAARVLRGAGALLLLYLAWVTYRKSRKPQEVVERESGSSRTLMQAAAVNILNPNAYIGWTLILGPAVVAAWKLSAINGVAVIVAFYAVLIVTTAFTILLFGTANLLGPRGRHAIVVVSALILTGLAALQIYLAVEPR